ncbi:MAG: PilN domain-containing protein [Leptolyngbyaceae cyanobacterium bins.59]|nr:PilN domain-containing protein [Leptolyngbyaceae cyanobacterium bins.59]
MYSLDINFLNDRPEYRPDGGPAAPKARPSVTGNAPLLLGLLIGVALPALAGGAWFILQGQNAELETKKTELTARLESLNNTLKEVEALRGQITAINTEVNDLASLFNTVKPWSAILEDISKRIPAGVQIDNIQEADGKLTMTGTGRTYADVNDFVLTLQKSEFLDPAETRLLRSAVSAYSGRVEVRFPGVRLGPNQQAPSPAFKAPEVASFGVATALNNKPASELLRELERNGSVGLVTRIRTLQEKGIIK